MDPGDDVGEAAAHVVDGGVRLGVAGQPCLGPGGGRPVAARRRVGVGEQPDRGTRPHRPVTEQPAREPPDHRTRGPVHGERGEQVLHDRVVVAGVEGHPRTALRRGDALDEFEGAVAVEGGGLDGHRRLLVGQSAPVAPGQVAASDRLLEVEADHRQHLADRRRTVEERRLVRVRQAGGGDEDGVVAERPRGHGLGHRLLHRPAHPRDADDRRPRGVTPLVPGALLGGQGQDGAVQPVVTERELRGVDPDGDAARPRVQVVAGQRPLAALVEAAPGVQGEGMGGDHGAAVQQGGGRGTARGVRAAAGGSRGAARGGGAGRGSTRNGGAVRVHGCRVGGCGRGGRGGGGGGAVRPDRVVHQNRPSRRSNLVGLSQTSPPASSQRAWSSTSEPRGRSG